VPVGDCARHAAAHHVCDLCLDLRGGVRVVANADVIIQTEPAQPGGIYLGCRAAVEQRSNGEFADVAGGGVAVGLSREGTGRAGIVADLGLKSCACRRNRTGWRGCMRTPAGDDKGYETEWR